jgi:hypothetical protein
MVDKSFKSTLILASAFMFPPCVHSNDRTPIFTGGLLIKVGRSSLRATHEAVRIMSRKDGWRFQSLDQLAPNSVSRKSIPETSTKGNGWYFAVPPERKEALRKTSYDGETLRQGWEKAHDEIEKNLVSNRSSLGARLKATGIEIVAIEPNFAFPIGIQAERNAPERKSSGIGDDQAQIEGSANPAWPSKSIGWHLGDSYSQLASARKTVAEKNHHHPYALIAHLDTGYDPRHVSLPRNFLPCLSTSFDPWSGNIILDNGVANQSGHGTGTLALLAGKRVVIPGMWDGDLGGAPDEKVFEVRINDTKFLSGVVHFSTASMYQAIRYASDNNADVISISAGGIPSQLWSEAVNYAYENGTAIFAASGDYFTIPILGIPFTPYHVVYPAAFSRVIPVTGVTCSFGSYGRRGTLAALLPQNWNAAMLRGNWGPSYEMLHAIAAYTPNVPWAQYEGNGPSEPCDNLDRSSTHLHFFLDGGGTSASTPQVAAAAALWIAYYHRELPPHHTAEAWRRAEAVYTALEKASAPGNYSPIYRGIFIGKGLLRAADALNMQPAEHLIQRRSAEPAWTWIGALNPVPFARETETISDEGRSVSWVVRNMYSLEAAQLIARSDKLRDVLGQANLHPGSAADAIAPKIRTLVIRTLIRDPQCSSHLRAFLTTALHSGS